MHVYVEECKCVCLTVRGNRWSHWVQPAKQQVGDARSKKAATWTTEGPRSDTQQGVKVWVCVCEGCNIKQLVNQNSAKVRHPCVHITGSWAKWKSELVKFTTALLNLLFSPELPPPLFPFPRSKGIKKSLIQKFTSKKNPILILSWCRAPIWELSGFTWPYLIKYET